MGYLFWERKSSGSLRTEGRWVDALLWLLALPISGLAGGALVFDIRSTKFERALKNGAWQTTFLINHHFPRKVVQHGGKL